jgi:hypothetical protein
MFSFTAGHVGARSRHDAVFPPLAVRDASGTSVRQVCSPDSLLLFMDGLSGGNFRAWWGWVPQPCFVFAIQALSRDTSLAGSPAGSYS